MKDKEHNHEADFEARISEAFREDLRSLYEAEAGVPREVDEQILAEARTHAPPRKSRIVRLRWAVAAAAAACVLIAISILTGPSRRSATREVRAPAHAAKDFDGNGRVDIVDAYQLARRLKEGGRPGKVWDLNGDGNVDGDDVDQLAMTAVSLKRRREQ